MNIFNSFQELQAHAAHHTAQTHAVQTNNDVQKATEMLTRVLDNFKGNKSSSEQFAITRIVANLDFDGESKLAKKVSDAYYNATDETKIKDELKAVLEELKQNYPEADYVKNRRKR